MAWDTTDFNGEEYFRRDGTVLIHPKTGAAVVLLKKDGGIVMHGVEAVEQGPAGMHALIDEQVDVTSLAFDDPTPDTASFTEIQPATESQPQIVRLHKTSRRGQDGNDGASVLNPASFGTPVAGRILIVNPAQDGFIYQAQKVGGRHLPGEINDYTGSGNFTLGIIPVSTNTYAWAWRAEMKGIVPVNAASTDVRVDLVARLGAADGPIIAVCPGIAANDRLVFSHASPADASDAFNKVAANAAAQIHVRVEKRAGSGDYSVVGADCRFEMQVQPVP